MRNLPSFELLFLCLSKVLFYSQFFKKISCPHFSEVWLWCVSVWIYLDLFCLELAYLLDSVALSLLINLGSFQPLFLRYFFSLTVFLLSWNSGDRSVTEIFVTVHRSLRLCSFLVQPLFCLVFTLGHSRSIPQFIASFLLSSILMSRPPVKFISVIIFSVLKFPFGFSLYFLLAETSYIFAETLYFSFISNMLV